MRRLMALVMVTAFAATGCAGGLTLTPDTALKPSAKPGDTTIPGLAGSLPQKLAEIVNLPVEPLAGVKFSTISQANAKTLGSGLGGGGMASAGGVATSKASAPMAAAAPASIALGDSAGNPGARDGAESSGGGDTSGGAYSGNSDSYYGYGNWFGGSEQMSLVSMTLGETTGSTTFLELTKAVSPIVKAWDATARLLETSGNLATDGGLFKPSPQPASASDAMLLPGCGSNTPIEQFWDGSAWRLIYRSTKRNEVLQIAGKADKTVIVRMRWAPLDLDLDEVKFDAGAAISKVAGMIKDKAAQAEEEKTKNDYFLGIPFEQRTGMEWQDQRRSKLEVLYTVPDGAQWSARLDRVLGKLVWQLSFYGYDQAMQERAQKEATAAFKEKGFAAFGLTDPDDPSATPATPAPVCAPYGGRYPYYGPDYKATPLPVPSPGYELVQPDPNVWINMSSNALVDASTGTVIRFSRPTKTINISPKYIQQIQSGQGSDPQKGEPTPEAAARPL